MNFVDTPKLLMLFVHLDIHKVLFSGKASRNMVIFSGIFFLTDNGGITSMVL